MHQVIGSALILFLTAGCFQAVGTDFQATDAANAQPTWTLIPTNTPFPTEPPLETSTPKPVETALPDLVFGAVVTTSDPFALLTPAELGLSGQVAQAATIDPILLTVTAIYANGAAQLQAFTTATPAVPAQPLDSNAIIATSIVSTATAIAGATQTQAAINSGAVPFVATADPNVFVATQAPSALVAGADCTHEVRATDRNLYRIAQNYGLTVQQVAQASGILNPDLIYVGQQLTIPGCGVTGAVPLPTSTSTAGVVNANAQVTGGTPPVGVTFTPIPVGQAVTSVGQTHSVRQGETLFEISLQYGTTVHSIAAVNGLSNINMIYIGQELTIP